MKAYNNYFYNAKMWKVFLSVWFVSGLMTFLMFQLLYVNIDIKPAPLSTWINIKIGACMGIVIAILWSLTVSMQRSNKKFWDECEEIEYDIKDCKTKEGLKFVYQNKFVPLSKKSFGEHHVGELKRLYAIIETKYDYLPES